MYSNVVDYGEGGEDSSIFCSQEEFMSTRATEVAREESMTRESKQDKTVQCHNLDDVMVSNSMNRAIKTRSGMKSQKDNPDLIMGKDIEIEQIPEYL